jgi:hypothetical protein
MKNEPKPLKYDPNPDRTNGVFDSRVKSLQALVKQRNHYESLVKDLDRQITILQDELPSSLVIRPFRMCHHKGCYLKTQDRWGGEPMCAKHIAGGQEDLAAIYDELLHGED